MKIKNQNDGTLIILKEKLNLYMHYLLHSFQKQRLMTFLKKQYMNGKICSIYKELLGLKSIKPLDCVGTPEETKAAMYLAYKRGELRDTPIMKYFTEEVLPDIQNPQDLIEQVVEYGNDILIPTHLHSIVRTSADAAVRDIMKLL